MMNVKRIKPEETKEWLLYKHYAKRIPNIVYAFGLFDGQQLVGVCTFGIPASPSLIVGSIGPEYADNFLELNRLCVNDGLPKNSLSHFVGECLKMLPKPMVVVSYADSGMNHCGYIYQATNFVYTGLTKPHVEYELPNEPGKHSRHALDEYGGINEAKKKGVNFIVKERTLKHRYFYFCGSKTQRRKMVASLKYPIMPYPKEENKRYDSSYSVHANLELF